ncbi:IS200/IS605 family transposase [Chryseolinea sp. T2]|uniref:IS200/IS605 family transposase n=1 Tax=Chryseolinea sp. T2 TaxID=3129255 RepID=UPI003076C556
MPNTYTQLLVQLVFAVKFREAVIARHWRSDLCMYISGIVRKHGHKLLCVNGVADHLHILVGMHPRQSISELVQEVKKASSKWINDNRLVRGHFSWQEGYSAFSYSQEALYNLVRYIENQKEHHKKRTFREEYVAMLKDFNIEFEDRYIYKELS